MNKQNMTEGSCQGCVGGKSAATRRRDEAFDDLYAEMEQVAGLVGRRKRMDWEDLTIEFWLRFCSQGRVEALFCGAEHYENRRFYIWRRMQRIAESLKRRRLAGTVSRPGFQGDRDYLEIQESKRKGLDCVEAVDACDTAERLGPVALDTFSLAERSTKFARIAALIAAGMRQRKACEEVGVPETTFRNMRAVLRARPIMRFIKSVWFDSGNGTRRPAA